MPYTMDQCFRGDADFLVDRLVEACALPAPLPFYEERELQPWCPDDDSDSSLSSLDEPLEARHRFPPKHGRSADSRRSVRHAAMPASPVARRCGFDEYACPSFQAAPKPEALPLPTSSLLTRALYRRSPSPPKA